ncbi:hypothetical protein NIES4075_20460 [Tolypothrix sp. NIES-4075]|nr:hypothetical protein NIES4075_20460 [Tolypothrix sp. NIES-4075]
MPTPNIMRSLFFLNAIARNFTLNLYRDQMFKNMAQAQRL